MGFFSNLFRGRDAPSNSTAGSGYGFFMGSTASGKRVNARSAMQMTAVYSCVRILSEAVAGLPLQFYRYNDNGGKEKAVDHPLYFLLHDEPNPEMTGYATARQNGWMSANDIRELENMDRIPEELGGDLYLINGNMTKLQDAGIFAGSGKGKDTGEEVLELEKESDKSGKRTGS